jgi:hypothetical protein
MRMRLPQGSDDQIDLQERRRLRVEPEGLGRPFQQRRLHGFQLDSELRAEFSDHEWTALQRFNSVFERVVRLLPHHQLPPIEEFIHSPQWLQLSKAAAKALSSLHSANGNDA